MDSSTLPASATRRSVRAAHKDPAGSSLASCPGHGIRATTQEPDVGRPTGSSIPAPHPPDRLLRLIALFRFFKAALLVAVGLGALRFVQPGLAERAQQWVEPLSLNSARHAIQKLISWLSHLGRRQVEVLAVASSCTPASIWSRESGCGRGSGGPGTWSPLPPCYSSLPRCSHSHVA